MGSRGVGMVLRVRIQTLRPKLFTHWLHLTYCGAGESRALFPCVFGALADRTSYDLQRIEHL